MSTSCKYPLVRPHEVLPPPAPVAYWAIPKRMVQSWPRRPIEASTLQTQSLFSSTTRRIRLDSLPMDIRLRSDPVNLLPNCPLPPTAIRANCNPGLAVPPRPWHFKRSRPEQHHPSDTIGFVTHGYLIEKWSIARLPCLRLPAPSVSIARWL